MNDVAFEVVQVSVEASPALIEVGFAASVHVGFDGGGFGVTVTVVLHTTEPPGPCTVRLYFVVAVGCTVTELLEAATAPMPLSSEALAAFVEVQESCELPPVAIAVGLAESTHVGGGVTGTPGQEKLAPLTGALTAPDAFTPCTQKA